MRSYRRSSITTRQASNYVSGYANYARISTKLDNVSDTYAAEQNTSHQDKVLSFLLPILNEHALSIQSILDVGCGTGGMVKTLIEKGYEAYGADLLSAVDIWNKNDLPKDRFMVVDPIKLQLPFDNDVFDLVYSLGAIEHVGTTDGHADRRHDYHEIRRQWLQEICRVVRPGKYIIIGGPNKCFPIDTHGPDSRASAIERWLSQKTHISIHRTWGDHFLCSYKDIESYLEGLNCSVEGLSIKNYYTEYKNVPGFVRPIFKGYLRYLPSVLLKSCFNPWMLALIRKKG